MASTKWSDLTPTAKAAAGGLAVVEVLLAVAAWTDLARRPADQVRGPKGVWAVIIGVNIVGPLTYFAKGRQGPPR
ncbi:PLDc N-terminal domain-containing protein [Georgenia faecalis]|uniref:PLDc N-terminal domain-containing protein n=1 Tax=Georgenia faecalis TaxID=2483799 RepID=A0ABV9D8I1_9MICO|nr:PLDc N-terminal domain-containing protein [Georgenia faecalis]